MTAPHDPDARIVAALRALAAGDAMGRATEHYRPDEILDVYDGELEEFIEPVRLFDDEVWAPGETGAPTELVCALASLQAADIVWGEDATSVDRLPLALAAGLADAAITWLGAGTDAAAGTTLATAMQAALAGRAAHEVVALAEQAARAADARLAGAIREAVSVAQATGGRRPGEALRLRFSPDGESDQLTPFILGLVYATQSARRAILEAVNQGGHAPETAGIAGALCAAIAPGSLPETWGIAVESINGLHLDAVARAYAVRLRPGTNHA
jgi:ADP-ribosylglycohydrolase